VEWGRVMHGSWDAGCGKRCSHPVPLHDLDGVLRPDRRIAGSDRRGCQDVAKPSVVTCGNMLPQFDFRFENSEFCE
jgi:NAD-dependent SIR2 family protein deacetylase